MKSKAAGSLVVGLLLALATAVLAGSAGSARTADVPLLRIGTLGAGCSNAQCAFQFTNEQLMVWTAKGTVEPWLAKSYKQPNPFVYIFTLRKGVKWWDGTELTAEDVEESLNFRRHPSQTTAFNFPTVRDVKATGRYTVQITLKRRDGALLSRLQSTNARIDQKAFLNRVGKDKLGRAGVGVMGTGPWKIDSFDPTRPVELTAFDGYWGGRPQIRHIQYRYFLNQQSMALAFRAGEIDVALGVTDGRSWEATTGKSLQRGKSCLYSTLILHASDGPFSDVHVRRAVAYSINANDVIAARGGFARPLYSLVARERVYAVAPPKEVDAMLARLPQYHYNLAKARAEMAQSAYPNGFKTEFWVYPGNAPLAAVESLIPMLKAIGIDLSLKSGGDFFGALLGPANKRPSFFAEGSCNSPDPAFFAFIYEVKKDGTAGQFNYANYLSPGLRELAAATDSAPRSKRLAAFEKLYRKIMLDVPYVPIYHPDPVLAISDRFQWPQFGIGGHRVFALEIKPR